MNDERLAEWERSGRTGLSDSADPKARQLIEAAQAGGSVDIVYYGGTTPGERRRIRPEEVFRVDGYGALYVEAYCETRGETRVFRLDRMTITAGSERSSSQTPPQREPVRNVPRELKTPQGTGCLVVAVAVIIGTISAVLLIGRLT